MVKRFLCAAVMSLSLIGAAQAHSSFNGQAGTAAAGAAINANGAFGGFSNHETGTNTSFGSTSISGNSAAGFQQNFASPKDGGNMSINFATKGFAHNDTTLSGNKVMTNSNFGTSGFSKGNAQFTGGMEEAFAQGSAGQESRFSNTSNFDDHSIGGVGTLGAKFGAGATEFTGGLTAFGNRNIDNIFDSE